MSSRNLGKSRHVVLSGLCPDAQCKTKLFFPAHDSSVECTGCGQRHQRTSLLEIEDVRNPDVAIHNILKNILVGNFKPKKGSDSIKVLGVSNYQCKLLSPILTYYGMDKQSGKARLLSDMGQRTAFDCGVLSSRAFMIEPEHIEVTGYGRDGTGSMAYLQQTLTAIKQSNGGEERLLPIHADGDGHCLVHAISRALIGRELFWHALRQNLKAHFTQQLTEYQQLFRDFIDVDEWKDIIIECDPDYLPHEEEPMGLRNIHVFGLANVLKRPIILLDSIQGIQSCGDYTGVFLPGLQDPDLCKDKDGLLNKPLCLAWSSSGRNHYIALVGVKGRPVPKLPNWMIPKAWGMPQELIPTYMNIDDRGSIEIGGEKCLQDGYVLKLIKAMEEIFKEKKRVPTSLVADYHQYVLKGSGIIAILPEHVVQQTRSAVSEDRLFRCLVCEAIMEWTIDPSCLLPTGALYQLALKTHGTLDPSKKYSFPTHDVICSYDANENILVVDQSSIGIHQCRWCQGSQMRLVKADGKTTYQNGDRTTTPTSKSNCRCGFKHYWDGSEYDNLPEMLPVVVDWNGKLIGEKVPWFQHESDPSLNSNVFDVAQKLVQKHLPGEFGSERLVQKVVDTILRQTKAPQSDSDNANASAGAVPPEIDDSWRADTSSKIILTGFKSKTTHKEELTQSKKEKELKKNIEEKAPFNQHKSKTSAVQATKTQPKSARKGDEEKRAQQVTQKKVRVSTSDGKQLTISIDNGLTFTALLNQLEHDLNTSRDQMKIRHGIPPRELKPKMTEGKEQLLPLHHGDRIIVEITAKQQKESPTHAPWPATSPTRKSWSAFDAQAHNHSANDLLNQLTQLHGSEPTDSLDSSIASLALMANLIGKDLWAYVQGMPHLFSVGGLYYQQVARDLGFSDGKHVTLPSLPNKVFRYSAKEDRLELCLEPHGHFAVEPNIEARVLNSAADSAAHPSSSLDLQSHLMSGSHGIAVNQPMQIPAQTQAPFAGQGQQLGGVAGDRMPRDLEPVNHPQKLKATKLTHFSSSGSRPNSIDEEEEKVAEAPGQTYRRIGPGYRMIDQSATNSVNHMSETFHALTSKIDSLVQEMDNEEPQDRDSDDMDDN